jgi:hypothetical protein
MDDDDDLPVFNMWISDEYYEILTTKYYEILRTTARNQTTKYYGIS